MKTVYLEKVMMCCQGRNSSDRWKPRFELGAHFLNRHLVQRLDRFPHIVIGLGIVRQQYSNVLWSYRHRNLLSGLG
jgi:hypothetical protein